MTDAEKIEVIVNGIRAMFKKEVEITPDSQLTDLGLDSLDIVELQMYLEETRKIIIPDEDSIKTIRDLMAFIK